MDFLGISLPSTLRLMRRYVPNTKGVLSIGLISAIAWPRALFAATLRNSIISLISPRTAVAHLSSFNALSGASVVTRELYAARNLTINYPRQNCQCSGCGSTDCPSMTLQNDCTSLLTQSTITFVMRISALISTPRLNLSFTPLKTTCSYELRLS